jgi:hypothetical protein
MAFERSRTVEKALLAIRVVDDFDIPADSSPPILQFEVTVRMRSGNANRLVHERGVRVQASWLVKTAHFIMER